MNLAKATWQNILDAIPDMVSILDDQHRIVWLNKKMQELLNLPFELCIGKFCYELVHGTNEPPDYCPYSKFLEDKTEHTVEVYISNLNGDFLVTVSPVKSNKGVTLGAIYIARDITQIKKQQQDLLLNESKFAVSFINSPVAMCITKLSDGTLLDVNKAWFGITGYTRDEAVNKSIKNLDIYVDIEDRNRIIKLLNNQSYVNNYEVQLKNKQGELIYGQMSVSLVIINGDKCGITTFVNKTGEVKLEKYLREMEHTLLLNARNNIVQSLKEGVLVKDYNLD